MWIFFHSIFVANHVVARSSFLLEEINKDAVVFTAFEQLMPALFRENAKVALRAGIGGAHAQLLAAVHRIERLFCFQ